ncbi:MAG: FAD-dependent oxidoreductase [Nitrososphaeraceae archaeon]
MNIHNKLIIIGSGPAGLTASIYAARGGIEPLVISGNEPGGQLMYTSEVENFPGFDEPVLGPILMEKMRKQAQRFGTRFVDKAISAVDFSSKPFCVKCSSTDNNTEEYFADSVIIATGASALWLGLESEQRLRGRGVSSCATCDGFFFKGKDVVVVGGGDTAMEEALFLIKFTKGVKVIHRRDKLNASAVMQQKAFRNEKITFLWNTIVQDIVGDSKVKSVRVKNVITGESQDLRTDGVFVAIGHKPNTELFKGQIELDERGYIKKYEESKTTSMEFSLQEMFMITNIDKLLLLLVLDAKLLWMS